MRITASLRTFCHLSNPHSDSTITRLWIEEVAAVARQRDRDSFMRIYDHFAPRLLRYLTGLNVPEGQAEELVQEVLLKLWHTKPAWGPGCSASRAICTSTVCARIAVGCRYKTPWNNLSGWRPQ